MLAEQVERRSNTCPSTQRVNQQSEVFLQLLPYHTTSARTSYVPRQANPASNTPNKTLAFRHAVATRVKRAHTPQEQHASRHALLFTPDIPCRDSASGKVPRRAMQRMRASIWALTSQKCQQCERVVCHRANRTQTPMNSTKTRPAMYRWTSDHWQEPARFPARHTKYSRTERAAQHANLKAMLQVAGNTRSSAEKFHNRPHKVTRGMATRVFRHYAMVKPPQHGRIARSSIHDPGRLGMDVQLQGAHTFMKLRSTS